MIRKVGFLFAIVVLLTIVSVVSQAQSQSLMTRHTRDAVVNGQAQSIGRLPAYQTMKFDIVLALRHPAELDNFLQALYDPTSSSYRQFVTPQQFTERFGPSQEDYEALLRFAQQNGFTVTGGSRDAMDVQFKAPVAAVEKAFRVTMGVYQHPTEKRTFYAPDREPTVDLPFALWHISGLDNYSIPRALVEHRNTRVHGNVVKGSCPGGYYCGSDMRAAYYGGSLTGAGQNLGLLEYVGYNIADVNTYYSNVHQTLTIPIIGISTDGTSVNCVHAQGCDDTEQTLDITQAAGMAPSLTGLYVFVGSSDTAILSSMSTHTPLVGEIGSSWTWTPGDPTQTDPYFKKFAAQGQNYFQASGDSGSYKATSRFVFPADDDYVTTVGGTDLQVQSAGGPWASETGWSGSGGGFYTVDNIPIPSWQQLAGVINSQNKGSTTLRNAPDVAGEANFDFYVCSNQSGCAGGWGGTSFAAPMWAGYMALVNQQSLANGNPQLGFINPIIYPLALGSGYASLFHDITSGSNGGFTAVAGFDLVTGWGSPNGSGLIDALAGGGGGGPVVSLNPTSLKWGKIVVHSTGAAKKVVLTNTGNATLNISTIATSGDFALVAVKQTKKVTPCVNGGTVAAGATCEIKVSFTPTQTGPRTGQVLFTDNASDSPQSVSLTGTGK